VASLRYGAQIGRPGAKRLAWFATAAFAYLIGRMDSISE